ncbi:MAG: ribosome maturation factor RimM [Pseudomonadota bacterium]
MQNSDTLIYLGVVTGAHGIRGDVIIHSLTEPSSNITKLKLQNELGEEVSLKLIRPKVDTLIICSMAGVTTRNAAEELRGIKFYTLRSLMPKLPASEYYIEDMKGLEVRNLEGRKIGEIVSIHNFGAGDIVEINFNNGSNEMYPFTQEIFPEISEEYIAFDPKKVQSFP